MISGTRNGDFAEAYASRRSAVSPTCNEANRRFSIAWPAARTKHSYFQAQFLRLKSRRGPKKAIVAVAASMLTAMYYMLRDGTEFRDLGDQHFAQRDKTRVANRLIQRLRDLGVDVEIKAA